MLSLVLADFSLASAAERYRYLSDCPWFLRGQYGLINGLRNATVSDASVRAPLRIAGTAHSQTRDLAIPKHNVYLKTSEIKALGS